MCTRDWPGVFANEINTDTKNNLSMLYFLKCLIQVALYLAFCFSQLLT